MPKDTSWFLNTGENADTLTISIRKPSTQYLDEFFRLRCAPDIMQKGVFNVNNPTKEISESMAVFAAVRKELGDNRLREGFLNIASVGDGSTPRTASIFAYRTKAACYSIDPLAKEGWAIERLYVIPKAIEDVVWSHWTETVLVACHSHANLDTAVRILRPSLVVAMECCVPQTITAGAAIRLPQITSHREYHDWGVWSDKRRIKIWHLKWYQDDELKSLSKRLENG